MMNSLAPGNSTLAAEVTNISSHGLWLLANEKELFMSYDDFPWFKSQTIEAVINIEEPSPNHFYWPDIDVDLTLESIENPECFPLAAKKNYPFVFYLFTVFILLSGCKSTGVIPMEQDSYYIGKKDGSPGLGVSFSNKAEVYKEANTFCSDKGLEVKILRETVTPAVPARLGSTELHFKCEPLGGKSKPMTKEADTVIEIRQQ